MKTLNSHIKYSLIVEKEKFQLFNVVPLVREFFGELNNLYKTATKPEWKRIINIIDASMRSRLSHNKINETITAYALSSLGRNELRNKYRGYRTQNISALTFTTIIETLKEERIIFEKKYNPDVEEESVIENTSEIFEEEDSDIEPNDLENQLETDDLHLEIDEIMNVPFEERILKDIYKNIYQISKSELVRAGSLLDIDYKYIEKKFDEYLFADPLQIDFIKYSFELPYNFW
ncbi:hypothetical protein M9Y10_037886 [Tritrichomonas musculus]|uniref:Uncharacterized protein n=1 Tax=Tritrichomonas musculus TaxID=1915356 RepID=A0ABR2K6W8_9EUKA